MRKTRQGKKAMSFYSITPAAGGSIPIFKWVEMVAESGTSFKDWVILPLLGFIYIIVTHLITNYGNDA